MSRTIGPIFAGFLQIIVEVACRALSPPHFLRQIFATGGEGDLAWYIPLSKKETDYWAGTYNVVLRVT